MHCHPTDHSKYLIDIDVDRDIDTDNIDFDIDMDMNMDVDMDVGITESVWSCTAPHSAYDVSVSQAYIRPLSSPLLSSPLLSFPLTSVTHSPTLCMYVSAESGSVMLITKGSPSTSIPLAAKSVHMRNRITPSLKACVM